MEDRTENIANQVKALLPCFCPNRGGIYSLTQTDPDPKRQNKPILSICGYHQTTSLELVIGEGV